LYGQVVLNNIGLVIVVGIMAGGFIYAVAVNFRQRRRWQKEGWPGPGRRDR
jgi:hypothetical protein